MPSAVSTGSWDRDRAGFGALDIVHRLDQVVNAERHRGHEDHAEILEAGEDVIEGRQRHVEAEIRERVADTFDAQPAIVDPSAVEPQAMSMPTAMATSPAGIPRGYLKPRAN